MLTSIISRPPLPSAIKAVLPSAERITSLEEVPVRVAVREGLAGLLTSIIRRPWLSSATKAVLPSAERVTPLADFEVSRDPVRDGLALLLTSII